MAGVKGFNFRFDTKAFHLRRHFTQHGRAVGHDIIAMPKIHGTAIQRANFRQAISDMRQPFGCACHIGAVCLRRQRGFDTAQH